MVGQDLVFSRDSLETLREIRAQTAERGLRSVTFRHLLSHRSGLVRPDSTLWHKGWNTLWYAEAFFDTARGIAAVAACNDGNTTRRYLRSVARC